MMIGILKLGKVAFVCSSAFKGPKLVPTSLSPRVLRLSVEAEGQTTTGVFDDSNREETRQKILEAIEENTKALTRDLEENTKVLEGLSESLEESTKGLEENTKTLE